MAARALALVALAGLAVSSYLTVLHLQGVPPPCGSGGCAKVQASGYAQLLGLPISLYGAGAFAAIFAASIIPRAWAAAAALAIAVASVVFTLYLKYVELFVIDALCRWCLVSAIAAVACLALSARRLFQYIG